MGLGGVLARRRPPTAWPSSRRMPEPSTAIGTAMAPVSMNFGPQNCGAVPRTSAHDQGVAGMIEDYYDFPMGSNSSAVGQSPTRTAMAAANWRGCDVVARYWGREISKLGHTVRLIPPAYVKPFVKRQKNDAADAEAICEAAQRPSMRFVPVKDEEQQANGVVFRARDLLVRQRTQC